MEVDGDSNDDPLLSTHSLGANYVLSPRMQRELQPGLPSQELTVCGRGQEPLNKLPSFAVTAVVGKV